MGNSIRAAQNAVAIDVVVGSEQSDALRWGCLPSGSKFPVNFNWEWDFSTELWRVSSLVLQHSLELVLLQITFFLSGF